LPCSFWKRIQSPVMHYLGEALLMLFCGTWKLQSQISPRCKCSSLNFFFSKSLCLCWNALKLLFHKEAVATVANR
jgi:hypothetical protein